jgi:hypothetical protein
MNGDRDDAGRSAHERRARVAVEARMVRDLGRRPRAGFVAQTLLIRSHRYVES